MLGAFPAVERKDEKTYRLCTVKKNLRDSWISFDQIFLGLGLGKLFPARESLVSDIPAGDRNTAKKIFTV